ncbi:peptide ABC transporter substrate-binding protein [Clostridium sp. MB40-C1]|uniref:peptide ABC transporter substrate-binding protein n=1 Tax=Clostridium sp. MB40-C1 TaxID=3070996 RepID=UPI0027E0F249|nr:peptide ABC transporter substrate-binding protein [Clostridium sp. MB40-C1]WMJ79577.1 peptide ABC transporter substrate-binding protein [Clostridium sp. MB40-C1]
MKKVLSIFLVLFMFTGSGCIKKKEVNTKEIRDYIIYNLGKMPEDLTMLKSNNLRDEDLLICLFEGLICTNEKGEIIPGLASEWKISDDKLSYTFKIRNNARWSDGSYITSKDFTKFFKDLLNAKGNIYKQQLYCIFGAKDYAENKINFNEVAIIEKDTETLEIRLNYPCSYFLNVLSQPMYALKKDFNSFENWKDNHSNIVYSGPFSIKSISNNNEILLSKNEMYWDKNNVPSSKIIIKNEESSALALANYKWNQTDIILNPPVNEIKESINGNEIINFTASNGISLNFNLKKQGISRDINFRKCISYCIDREEISKKILGQECERFIEVGTDSKILFDKHNNFNKAKDFLSKSSYKGEKIRVAYLNTDENNRKIVEEIEKSLGKIKIKTCIEECDNERFNEIIKDGDYDIVVAEYSAENSYPLAFLEKWTTSSTTNIFGYTNWNYDNLILKTKITTDGESVKKLLSSAQDILYEDIPCIPLCFLKNTVCKKENVEGLAINKRGNVILKKAYLKKEN